MNLFAHHAEPQHYPVLAIIFAAGLWLGWLVMSRVCQRPVNPKDAVTAPPG